MRLIRGFWVGLSAVLLACSSDSDIGQIKVTMVDSPAEYGAVNIDLTGIEAHQAGSDSIGGWISISSNPGTYDLLTLRNGLGAVIADKSLPAGHYTQLRLLLGDGSNVIVDGVQHPLVIPSGMQTGLKLNHQFTIEANTVYDLTLDFEAERSIVMTGGGEYQLQPVIRIQATESAGSISGIVLPAMSASRISIVVATDTVAAYADTTSGYFKLMAIPAEVYSVAIVPATIAYRDTVLEMVTVMPGQNTDVGQILLSEAP